MLLSIRAISHYVEASNIRLIASYINSRAIALELRSTSRYIKRTVFRREDTDHATDKIECVKCPGPYTQPQKDKKEENVPKKAPS